MSCAFSSAGTNTLGGMGPNTGSSQRARASKPQVSPVSVRTMGWKNG